MLECRIEAEGWSSLLSQDWDLETVKEAAAQCVSDRCHWLDDGTEHPHRIALSVHKDEVKRVKSAVMDAVTQAGFKAQMIVSGAGDYKYLDILSVHGGKRKAMEYVRSIFGIRPERVVAAGDSGNDILMLEGLPRMLPLPGCQSETVTTCMLACRRKPWNRRGQCTTTAAGLGCQAKAKRESRAC